MVDENDSSTVLINSISQNDPDSQEKPAGNVFGPNVLPTAKEAMEQARRKARAAKAKTETERTGILFGAREDAIRDATNASKATGIDVRFYRKSGEKVKNDLGYYNHKDGKIYINADIKDPIAFIFGHEMVHHIQSADKYIKFFDTVIRKIQEDGGNIREIRRELADRYAESDVILTSLAQIDQEVVAEYAQKHLFTDAESITSIVGADKESGRKILGFLDKIRAKFGNADVRERVFIDNARKIYARALQETAGSNVKPPEAHGAETAEAKTKTEAAAKQPAKNARQNAPAAAEDGGKRNPFSATVLPTAAERFGTRTAEENNPSTADAVPLPLHKGGETAEVRAEESTMPKETEPERGKAIYDGLTEEEYDAMADVQEAEESMAGHSMLYEDGRQYSIRKEKEVAKRDGKQYNKKQINMNSQEHTLVKSAIMKKESARTDGDIPNVDSVYAYDKYYLYEPTPGHDGIAFARFDPEADSDIIQKLERGLQDGTLRDKKALSGRIKAFRGGKRFGVLHNGNDENGRTGDGTAGVHGSELGSNDVGHPGGGVRNQSGFGLDQESGKSEATLRLQYEQQIREDAYLSELARRREIWEIDDVAYEKLYNEYVSTNPELMEREAKIMRAARDRARLAVTKSNESDRRQYSINKGKEAAKKDDLEYNKYNMPTRPLKAGDTFPPQNISKSEANELATRWTHREDVKNGDRVIVNYHGIKYTIVKDDNTYLRYTIERRLTKKEYPKAKRFYEEVNGSDTYAGEQQGGKTILPNSTADKKYNRDRTERSGNDTFSGADDRGSKDAGAISGRTGERANSTGDTARSIEDKQNRGTVHSVGRGGRGRGLVDGEEKQYAIAKDAGGEKAEGLPRKAQAELTRAEKYLAERVGEILGVPKHVQRDFLHGIIRDISEDYLQNGTINRTKADTLFEEAYRQGVVVSTDYYEQYKHVLK